MFQAMTLIYFATTMVLYSILVFMEANEQVWDLDIIMSPVMTYTYSATVLADYYILPLS